MAPKDNKRRNVEDVGDGWEEKNPLSALCLGVSPYCRDMTYDKYDDSSPLINLLLLMGLGIIPAADIKYESNNKLSMTCITIYAYIRKTDTNRIPSNRNKPKFIIKYQHFTNNYNERLTIQ